MSAIRIGRRALIAAAALPLPAFAQAWPTRTIRIVVPYPAGSGPDQYGRVVARFLQEDLGQPVVVENRAGALAVIGTQEVARSRPDGYTLLATTNTPQAANVALVKNLPYHPVRDFTPIQRTVTGPMMLLVRPDFPANDLRGFVEYAKAQPPPLAGGFGSAASRVALAKLQQAAGANFLVVPYQGIPPAVNDLIGGHIALTFADPAVAVPMIRAGTLKSLGVTASRPIAMAPQVEALGAIFPGFEVTGWLGIVAPAGTPEPVVQRLDQGLRRMVADAAMQRLFETSFYVLDPLGPAEFAAYIEAEIARWTRDAALAGLEPQ